MSNQVSTIATASNAVVSFFDKKNVAHELTFEGAVHKGGAALVAVKDMVTELALSKCVNGKYRAAAEIISIAFPSVLKAYTKHFKNQPWSNKEEFVSFLRMVENAEPGKSGKFNAKQESALCLLSAVRNIPSLARPVCEAVTIENEVV